AFPPHEPARVAVVRDDVPGTRERLVVLGAPLPKRARRARHLEQLVPHDPEVLDWSVAPHKLLVDRTGAVGIRSPFEGVVDHRVAKRLLAPDRIERRAELPDRKGV